MFPSTSVFLVGAGLLSTAVQAHVALWHPSMYGFCDGGNGVSDKCTDTSNPIIPLQQQAFGPGTKGVGWWFHGAMDQPPAANTYFDFPAGGKITAELQCNKGGTSWQIGDTEAKKVVNVCGSNVNVHTEDTFDKAPTGNTKGCAIAMAWKSDPATIVPSDLIVVSTNRTCPFYHYTDFHMPADLPACPAGGCHAFWLWIHEAGDYGGYSKQMYMTAFKARVTNYNTKTLYPAPRLARKCVGAPNICVPGPKQPHFWMQNEKNNAPNPDFDPPYYNVDYNFANGAQTDLRVKPATTETAWQKKWSYKGCYYDTNKMYGPAFVESWQNEPDFCMATCDAAGFKYAGLEYGYECHCSNSEPTGSVIAESNCNVPCIANSGKMCGAGGIMNIYTKATTSQAAAAVKATTTSAKAAAVATTSKTTAAAAAAKVQATTTSSKLATTTSKVATAAAKVTTSAKAVATTTAKATTTKVVARGFDEDGNEAEEELDEEIPEDARQTVFVHNTETQYAFITVTVTETVEVEPSHSVERRDIPFLQKPHHGHNLNHHVGAIHIG